MHPAWLCCASSTDSGVCLRRRALPGGRLGGRNGQLIPARALRSGGRAREDDERHRGSLGGLAHREVNAFEREALGGPLVQDLLERLIGDRRDLDDLVARRGGLAHFFSHPATSV